MKRNGVDPWCKVTTEEVEIDGVKVIVTGLSVGEINGLSKEKKSDIESSIDLVVACCERQDGVKITESNAMNFRPEVLRVLNEAVARVNGFNVGNLKATGDDVSSSA